MRLGAAVARMFGRRGSRKLRRGRLLLRLLRLPRLMTMSGGSWRRRGGGRYGRIWGMTRRNEQKTWIMASKGDALPCILLLLLPLHRYSLDIQTFFSCVIHCKRICRTAAFSIEENLITAVHSHTKNAPDLRKVLYYINRTKLVAFNTIPTFTSILDKTHSHIHRQWKQVIWF